MSSTKKRREDFKPKKKTGPWVDGGTISSKDRAHKKSNRGNVNAETGQSSGCLFALVSMSLLPSFVAAVGLNALQARHVNRKGPKSTAPTL
jgi:hypothetical protein